MASPGGRFGASGGFVRRHRTSIASGLVLALFAAGLTAYAVRATGFPVHEAELDDGGIWVTNRAEGMLGRQNKPVAQLDGVLADGRAWTPAAGLDVLQNGAAVFSVDRDARTVMPVDVTMSAGLEDQRTAVAGQTELGGDVLAVAEPDTGKVWATHVDPAAGGGSLADLSQESKPLAEAGGGTSLAVTRRGTVLAASAGEGTLTTVRSSGTGFTRPETATLSPRPTEIAAVSAVGEESVVLDAGGTLSSGGRTASVGRDASLQQPGPASSSVLVATPTGLLAVTIETGEVEEVAEAQGAPGRPVRVRNCSFGVWAAGTVGTFASGCGDERLQAVPFELSPNAELVFRVNRDQLVLNDVHNGEVWNVDGAKPERISNWEAFRPEPQQEREDEKESPEESEQTQPPKAVDDELGARPGRTTVLHVLDNDLSARESILSIVDVTPAQQDGLEVRTSPDRQSILATVAAGVPDQTLAFRYTIDDGTSGKASQDEGAVSLRVHDGADSGTPQLRAHYEPKTYTVAAGGTVDLAVAPDWRDPTYGDPVVVQEARTPGAGRVSVTPEGLVRFTAPPRKGGVQTVQYAVSTGGAEGTESVKVNVLPAGGQTQPPQPEPDVAAGEIGAAITVRPLDNDVPGADAGDLDARLVLAGPVAPRGGLEVDTDRESGIVTVRGTRPGVHVLDYRAGFGAASPVTSQIRVDVSAPTKKSNEPIATPDTTAVRGMSPMTVDVLANDYDARGRMLVVQHAEPAEAGGQLQVAVVDGRWLRVSASDAAMSPRTQAVTYTLSNGDASVKGSLTVTQRDPLTGADNAPVPESDDVTVRVGDSASVPVLDNDSTPSGDPVGLVLDPSVDPRGRLSVLPEVGRAYVSGRRVRYVAPESVDGPTDVEVRYVVENTGDPTAELAVGTVRVRVTPAPGDTNPNQSPTPRALEGRVVQGDVLRLKLPATGSDPDGDSVSVTGIGRAPTLGRVLAAGGDTVTYQAFPGVQGTDEFTYTLTDTFGASATGRIRIGVVPPGAPQDPVAVNDSWLAAPDRELRIDVLANDLRPAGTRLRIEPIEQDGVELEAEGGPVLVEAGAGDDGETLAVPYAVTTGLAGSRAELTVRYRDGWNNPPVAGDVVARPDPDSGSVVVDVLERVYDVDGAESDLSIRGVTGPDATTPAEVLPDRQVRLPVADRAQVWTYEVADADGGVSVGSVFVPARPVDTPYLRPGAQLRIEPGERTTVDVSELVVDPEGDPVVLTTSDKISVAPEGLLDSGTTDDPTEVVLVAGDRPGPGALSFEVSDRADLADPEAHPALLTVPVQIGDPVPQVNCPAEPVDVPEGGQVLVDVAAVCHVWTADPAEAAELDYDAEFVEPLAGVTVEAEAGGLRLRAGSGARRGSQGVLAVGADGQEATGRLPVRVTEIGPPVLSSVPARETEAGEPVRVDLADYLTTPLPPEARDVVVTSVQPLAGGAPAASDGSVVTVSPPAGTDGVFRYRVEVSDSGPDGSRPRATGLVEVAVVDVPGAPSGLAVEAEYVSNVVRLAWRAPASNGGARIERYEVEYDGQTRSCPGSPCRIAGLKNGQTYSFRVRAVNKVDAGEWSGTVTGTPDAFTGPVLGLKVELQRDHKVTLAWSPPAACDCSAVQKYRISWPGGGNQLVGAETRRYAATVRTNGDPVTFRVVPLNLKGMEEGKGPEATVEGMGAGKPVTPSAPSVSGTNRPGNTVKAVTVRWAPVGPDGPGPVRYQVTRTGGGVPKTVCAWVTELSCSDELANDGTTYSYSVQAKNLEADSAREAAAGGALQHVSAVSPPATMEAAAPPDAVRIQRFVATGQNGTGEVTFDVGASHGRTNVVNCSAGGSSCGEWTFPVGGQAGVTRTIGGLGNGSSRSVRLWSCNGSAGNDQTGSSCSGEVEDGTVPYGPIGNASLDVGVSEQSTTWRISVDPNGKPVHVRLTLNGSVVKEFDSGPGSFSDSGSNHLGYSQQGRYALEISDTANNGEQIGARRGGTSRNGSATTVAQPRTVTVSKGASAQGQPGCPSASCRFVTVTTSGFPGNVSCSISATNIGTVGFVSWTQGGNATRQSPNYFGDDWIEVTCGGVTSARTPW